MSQWNEFRKGVQELSHKKVGRRLAAWMREIGVSDPNMMPNHGWRRRMSSLLMGLHARQVEIEAILGHKGPHYGTPAAGRTFSPRLGNGTLAALANRGPTCVIRHCGLERLRCLSSRVRFRSARKLNSNSIGA